MLRSALAIAGMIGVAAISHRPLRHHLTSNDSHTHKPQSQDENQKEDGCAEQEVMMFNSDGIDVQLCCVWDDLCAYFNLLLKLHSCEVKCVLESNFYERRHMCEVQSRMSNSNAFDAPERRSQVLENVMESLADPNTHLIGVYGFYGEIKDTLLERVSRRVQRDQLFGIIVTTPVTKCPDVKKIQEDIAHQFGFTLTNKSKDKRAKELIDRIKNVHSSLIILHDLYKELDLNKVGIPYSAYHMGCKILLTSATEHVLSNHMHTQKNFMV